MYETKQNKVTSSRTLSCYKKKCIQHISDNRILKRNTIQNGKKKYEFIASNRPIQGVFFNHDIPKVYTFEEIEAEIRNNNFEELTNYLETGNLTLEEVLSYIEKICDDEELKYDCSNITDVISIALKYMQERMPQDTAEATEDIQISPKANIDMALTGLYNRFPTIYSYSMVTSSQQINENSQGPHTLSHISTDYLLDNMITDSDWRLQVPNPDTVKAILNEIGVLETNKTKRYLEDYGKKYSNMHYLINEGLKKPTAILRELMEMHPMAVYSWRGNLNKDAKGVAASKSSLMGKGEIYGNKITVDKRWQPIGISTDKLLTHPITKQMLIFLQLRLSMVIPNPEKQLRIAQELLQNGEYIITDEDKM